VRTEELVDPRLHLASFARQLELDELAARIVDREERVGEDEARRVARRIRVHGVEQRGETAGVGPLGGDARLERHEQRGDGLADRPGQLLDRRLEGGNTCPQKYGLSFFVAASSAAIRGSPHRTSVDSERRHIAAAEPDMKRFAANKPRIASAMRGSGGELDQLRDPARRFAHEPRPLGGEERR